MPEWEPSWNTYMARANGAPHSFVLDMGAAAHAPLRSHPLRLQVRVQLLRPRPDGLRDGSELEAMGNVEDVIVARLGEALEALYVGRFVGAGYTTLVFYMPERPTDALQATIAGLNLRAAVHHLGPYTPEWFTQYDAEWGFYLEFLYPDERARQRMLNRDQLQHRLDSGDRLELPRTVDHLAFFPSNEAAHAASRALNAAGFTVDPATGPTEASEGSPGRDTWGLEFHRAESLVAGEPDAFCEEIGALIGPFDGDYDGWGAMIVKGDK